MTIPALTKPVDELTAQDICGLIANQIQEGEHVEFKEGLSSSGNAGQTTAPIRITNDDKTKILKEIVAFANGYGGRLFIGIKEDGGDPPVAATVKPLADCANLADRLERACADLIDPPMLRFYVAGIATEKDGSGVVVFDAPRSTRSPHMSNRDHRAYRRRGSESVPIDMRDIQDMTLRSASRFSEIEEGFEQRKSAFDDKAQEFESSQSTSYCFRLSFVPLSDLDIGQVHNNPSVVPETVNLSAYIDGTADTTFPMVAPWEYLQERQILRGTLLTDFEVARYKGFSAWELTLWSDGGFEMWSAENELRNDQLLLLPEWLLSWIANGLRNVERVRRYADLPSLELGLEIELRVVGQPLSFPRFRRSNYPFNVPRLDVGTHIYPRYEVGAVNTFDHVASLIIKDWFNDAGYDWRDRVVVDYQLDGS